MVDACAGAHRLDVARGDGAVVLLAVAMLQPAFQGNGDNLHVFMGMGAEAFAGGYTVVIVQYAQGTEVHTARVVVSVETECMVTVEPIV